MCWQDAPYLRPDLAELVDEAFFRLQGFASRSVAPSVLRDGGEHVFVVVYASAHEARRERASISVPDYKRQGLFIRGRGNVLVLADRDRIGAAEKALDHL